MSNSEEHPPSASHPVIVSRPDHNISRKDIDPDALKVLYRLHHHGHIAYLVGGGVRDLLLGRKPKDFDISTSAHPNQVRKLFSNCRLIGRRFRLAHIYFHGGKIIEVSTFRTISEFNGKDGPIKSDNTFGTPEEDASRRDFTVNALLYNIADFSIIDYLDGLNDLKAGIIRCIGDPTVRFREDPIRMLRAVRFASLLGFSLDPASVAAISTLRDEIWDGAVPRILEEIVRMMDRGSSGAALSLLHQVGLVESILPEINSHIRKAGLNEYLDILSRLDHYSRDGTILKPWLTIAVLVYPLYHSGITGLHRPDHLKSAREVLSPIAERIQIPRKIRDTIRQSLAAQHRFFALRDRRYSRQAILRKSYFLDALSLFEMTAGGTEEGRNLISSWKEIGKGVPDRAPRPKKRRRRRRGPSPNQPSIPR